MFNVGDRVVTTDEILKNANHDPYNKIHAQQIVLTLSEIHHSTGIGVLPFRAIYDNQHLMFGQAEICLAMTEDECYLNNLVKE